MKKRLLIYLSFVLVLMSSCKKEEKNLPDTNQMRYAVSKTEAMNVGSIIAIELFKNKNLSLKSANANEAIDQIFPVGDIDTSMYVINYKGNNGFAVLSADKSTAPVVMYSETGKLDPDSVSDALVLWLAQTKSYIENNIKNQSIEKRNHLKKVWSDLMNGKTYMLPTQYLKANSLKSTNNNIPPSGGYIRMIVPNLLTTSWEQDCGYNSACPVENDGPCGNAYAGCVAVAQAQVMAFWKYPSSYNWSQMANDYGTPETARLIRAVGDAVHMDYGGRAEGGSGAQLGDVPAALINTFGYANTAIHAAYDYGRVVSNITKSWPVIMGGYMNERVYYTGIWPFRTKHYEYTGGHVWVCSGVLMLMTIVNGSQQQNDYLYMNWGFGHSENGWCLNTVQNFYPSTDKVFKYKVTAIYDIHP